MEQAQVFISYRRESDAAPVAELLKDALTYRGYRTFLDTQDNTRSGDWRRPLEAALESASDIVVLVSPGAMDRCAAEDDVMRWEIETALRKYDAAEGRSVHVIPVFWETESFKGSSVHSAKTELPQEVRRLYRMNGVSFHGNIRDLTAMYNAVTAMLCSRPGEVVEEVYDPPVSTHRSDDKKEVKRLHLQERFGRELDTKLIGKALKAIGKKQGIRVLDVGCADGYVTERRFTPGKGFAKVVGIDRNENVIRRAREGVKDGAFIYEQMDVEREDFPDRLRAVMALNGIEAFDVIFSALTLHHLNRPVALLEKLNDFLAPNGVILLRGVDDDAQLLYSYNKKTGAIEAAKSNLVRDVTRLSIQTKGMSNRFHGRQLVAWLKQAGYTDIETAYAVLDTVGTDDDEREAIYNYYFSFRTDYTERAMEADPEDARKQRIHAQLAAKLASLKKLFLDDDDIYYMVLSFGAVAHRHP